MVLLKRLKYAYDNLKIQTKFAVCILVAILMPFVVLGSAFYNRLYDMIATDIVRNEQEAASKTVPQVEQVLEQVTGTYDAIVKSEHWEKHQHVELVQSINELLENDSVKNIKIYVDLPENAVLFSDKATANVYEPLSAIKGTYWYGIFQGSSPKYLYCPPFYMGNNEKKKYGDCAYIAAENMIYQEEYYPCYIAIYYDSEPIAKILQDGISFPGSVSYIINEREAVIASTDDYLTGMYYVQYANINSYLMSSNNFIERNVLGEKIYVGFNRIEPTGWFMVTVTPSDPLRYETIKVLLEFVAICLLCIACAYLLAMWQARSITSRISDLAKQMAEGRKGAPISMPAPSVHDEVGELIETYNYMTGRMNQLMEKQKETAEELRIAEFKSLQAQINPHFLYNTMDMINWMALRGQTVEISNAVQQLAKFYKLTLSRKSNFMSLEEELEHVSIYVELQNMRFMKAIEFVVDIPDEMMGYSIPKLTLQPIVENAILHGIREKEEKSGSIVITGWREDGDYILLVSDDGVGISQQRLLGILVGQKDNNSHGTNIAVYNIHKRLEILYGVGYGLQYSSIEGQGTEVRIKIPAVELEIEE